MNPSLKKTPSHARIHKEFIIERNDIANAGTVASSTKRILKNEGFPSHFIKRVTIGVYEAEINVVIHSYGGKVIFDLNDDNVSLVFADKGPGIEDIELAKAAGFSTASSYAIENGFGAGMGLPNIEAVSDEMHLTSSNEGTTLSMRFDIGDDGIDS